MAKKRAAKRSSAPERKPSKRAKSPSDQEAKLAELDRELLKLLQQRAKLSLSIAQQQPPGAPAQLGTGMGEQAVTELLLLTGIPE